MSRILSGIRASGDLHLGNYLGAIQQWIALQDQHDVFFMVADLHAITTPYDQKTLQATVRQTVIDFLAAGLDTKKSVVFVQSHVPAHSELMWLLNTITPFGELQRMTQWKEKVNTISGDFEVYKEAIEHKRDEFLKSRQRSIALKVYDAKKRTFDEAKFNIEFNKLKDEFLSSDEVQEMLKGNIKDLQQRIMARTNAGILNYPILQAADVLAYKPVAVPVGEDQVQHIEMSRDLAKKFNRLFGQTFPEPQAMLTHGRRVMDLQHPDKKMSKSLGGGILLCDDEATILNHLKKAVTSSEPRVIREAMKAASDGGKGATREWKGDENLQKQYAGLRNLFTIMMALADESTIAQWETAADTGELQFSEFKPMLAKLIADHFADFRTRRAELIKDKSYVDFVIADGAKRANEVANATLLEVQQKMGLR